MVGYIIIIIKKKNMKQLATLFLVFMQFGLYAQTKSEKDFLVNNAVAHLTGLTRNYDPILGKKIIDSAVELGNAKAMNALGNLYLKGITVSKNIDSAIYWYKQSAGGAYSGACLNLGNLYREGKVITQDFTEAVRYYTNGIKLNNIRCKNMMAYMYYKGFGITQDYYKSFNLYKETAKLGSQNAMYFLGLCYRNGYGTNIDKEQADFWLRKSASYFFAQANIELKEDAPENISVVTPYLQNQLLQIKQTTEKFIASDKNNYEGIYNGYAVYYDWSGKFVTEIKPLILKLKKTDGKYICTWKEANYNPVDIKIQNIGNNFKFDVDASYKRNNHYSGRRDEEWNFNSANLALSFNKDSIQLSGNVKFYSKGRNEPGKPIQIILKKLMRPIEDDNNESLGFLVFPNPAVDYTTVEFSLLKTAKISFKIYTQNGSLVYTDSEKILPEGTYKYNLPTSNLSNGTYNIQILVNGKASTTNILVKQ
jgi:uncharacterized protein